MEHDENAQEKVQFMKLSSFMSLNKEKLFARG